jgi:hypothetical protein
MKEKKGFVFLLVLVLGRFVFLNNNLKFYFIKLIFNLKLEYSMAYWISESTQSGFQNIKNQAHLICRGEIKKK